LEEIVNGEDNPGIERFNDLTGATPLIKIYLAKKANPDRVLRYLYKNTSLQYHYGINFTMLDDGKYPKVFTWKELLQAHINHERVVYHRSFEFDLNKIKQRIHIIDGLLICMANIEEVVQTIRGSASSAAAAVALQKKFLLDADQAKAVLDMKLSRLAHLEVQKLENEKKDLAAQAQTIENILNNEELFKEEIKKGWREVASKFGDARRTKVISITKEDDEPTEIKQLQVSLTNRGNLFVTETSSLYTQRRGGVGNKLKLDDGEIVISTHTVASNEELLLFTIAGNVYHCSAANLAMEEKIHVQTIAPAKDWERVCAINSANKKTDKPYILFFTKKGMIKKSELAEYNITRNIGLKALTLDDGDEIVDVLFTDKDKAGIVTEGGNFLIIETEDIRPIGRVAKGVKAIKLNDGDGVASARLIPEGTTFIASISGNGLFKKTPMDEFVVQGRGTKGAKIQKLNDGDWVADFHPITRDGEVLVASTHACIKLTTNDIPVFSKGALGNKSIKLAPKDSVVGISIN
jgi:DNA gyrase subunit A